MTPTVEPPIQISLDIGHSSIGWAAFENGRHFDLLGTGAVIFPADDCLARKRRAYRRQRRHVRATRQRIDRLQRLLSHIGALSATEWAQLDCPWPWKLAAEVFQKESRTLSWRELWDVLRWYAHNRGYDGNTRWSRSEEKDAKEDTKKEKAALYLMEKHHTRSMAETLCAVLKIDPLGDTKSSRERFKGQNAAFPRETVRSEVKTLLEKHLGVLPHLTPELIRALVGDENPQARQWDDTAWKTIPVPGVNLPKRYLGSYLFGQSVPRFDNRIIASCPITYQRVLAETGDAQRAIRDSKVPTKKCREFLLYRWAMLLANLQTDKGKGMQPLTAEERKAIHRIMAHGDPLLKSKAGHLTKKQLKEAVIQASGALLNNVDACFLPPHAEDALWLRPERPPPGRAPYTREVLRAAVRDVFEGRHPAEKGNSLYRSPEVRQAELKRPLDQKTNNHLVRHRVLITRKLVHDIVKTYARGNLPRVERITVEVNRDLQAFSGMSNKEIEGELRNRLRDYDAVVKKLETQLSGTTYRITASLIRKARIAMDLDWTCPYTGREYDAISLAEGTYDKDHIIPRSQRPSDSLESLVITSRVVNAMKENRTSLQFIKEFSGKEVKGSPGRILFTEKLYLEHLSKLTAKGHSQDRDRKEARLKLLKLERYQEKSFLPKDLTQTSYLVRLAAIELEKEFDGLATKPSIISLPGSVTGVIRKGWQLYGCLAPHNPQVRNLLKRAETEDLNIKRELRALTHQHHALDACVIGYASHFLPNEGRLWEILVKRNRHPKETELLLVHGIFARDGAGHAHLRPLHNNLKEQLTRRLGECRVVQHLPKRMEGLIRLEENTRGIVSIKNADEKEIWNRESGVPLPSPDQLEGTLVHLRQYSSRDAKSGDKRIRKTSPTPEKAAKLLGLSPTGSSGKLRSIKGVRVIDANFGIALWKKDGKPDGPVQMRIIVWHKVWPQLNAIAVKENGGKWPRVLRNGHLIRVPQGIYKGIWKVASAKASLTLDLILPQKATMESKGYGQKREVKLSTLLTDGMTILPHVLTGTDACPTISSA